MNIIDTHCHIDLPVFDTDREVVLNTCEKLGIQQIIVPAIQASWWDSLLTITNKHKQLYPALGLHPVFIHQHQLDDLDKLESLVRANASVAIGEIGLDFYIKDTDKEKQILFFSRQLEIAEKYKLPVILHARKSHDDILNILKTKSIIGGSCHAFNGSLEQAKRYIDLGFKLGFGGTMTYPHSRKIHDLAKKLPLDSIILETDAPDMSGYQHKGERNQPDFIIDALQALAEIKSIDQQIIAEQTTANALALFRL